MFAVQLAVLIAIWAATVFVLGRRRESLLDRYRGVAPGRRVLLAVGFLLSSIVLLALGMAALAAGGLTPKGLTFWGWPLIAAVGSVFVLFQTLALVLLVLNAVTRDDRRPSDKVDADRP